MLRELPHEIEERFGARARLGLRVLRDGMKLGYYLVSVRDLHEGKVVLAELAYQLRKSSSRLTQGYTGHGEAFGRNLVVSTPSLASVDFFRHSPRRRYTA